MLGLPACDGLDETALRMLQHLARAAGHDALSAGGGGSLSGLVSLLQQHPAAVIIVSLAPGGLTQARYLCRRLRGQASGLRIVVSRLGRRREAGRFRKSLLSAGADRVVATLREACGQVGNLSRPPARLQEAPG
jgi:hypothetical protein